MSVMGQKKKIRLVLDTNWYVSATINRKSRRILYQLLIDEQLEIFYSDELLEEYKNVINRNKFKNLVPPGLVTKFMALVTSRLKKVQTKTTVDLSRDNKDNYLLGLCIDGKADYLITGDADLLVLNQIGETKILTLNEFIHHQHRLF